jgi:hypothetical protein
MRDISTGGWIALICIVVLLVATNISLLGVLRNRNKKPSPPQFLDSWKVMKSPWETEDRQWNELARKVKNLDEQSGNDPGKNT